MSDLRRTRIKFCGLTRAEDVVEACALGVDAVGFVFAARSKRLVSPETASNLRDGLQPFVDAVALFMDNRADEVQDTVAAVRPTILQFHGDEEDDFCAGFGLPYLKAIAMGGDADGRAASLLRRYPRAVGFLFDSNAHGQAGGSGHTFDWSRIPSGFPRPYLLAGGLHPENVFEAIRATDCWGVDVSSGIEISPGLKNHERMRRFVSEVRRADGIL
jgi:phosphoribosylanthranilate isomerase